MINVNGMIEKKEGGEKKKEGVVVEMNYAVESELGGRFFYFSFFIFYFCIYRIMINVNGTIQKKKRRSGECCGNELCCGE